MRGAARGTSVDVFALAWFVHNWVLRQGSTGQTWGKEKRPFADMIIGTRVYKV